MSSGDDDRKVLLKAEFDTSALTKGADKAAEHVEEKLVGAAENAERALTTAAMESSHAWTAELAGVQRSAQTTTTALAGTAEVAQRAARATAAGGLVTQRAMQGVGQAVGTVSGLFAAFGAEVPGKVFSVTTALAGLVTKGLGPAGIAMAGLAAVGALVAADYKERVPSAFEATTDKLGQMEQAAERARVQLELLRRAPRPSEVTSEDVDVGGAEKEVARRRREADEFRRGLNREWGDLPRFLGSGLFPEGGFLPSVRSPQEQKDQLIKVAERQLALAKEMRDVAKDETEIKAKEQLTVSRTVESFKAALDLERQRQESTLAIADIERHAALERASRSLRLDMPAATDERRAIEAERLAIQGRRDDLLAMRERHGVGESAQSAELNMAFGRKFAFEDDREKVAAAMQDIAEKKAALKSANEADEAQLRAEIAARETLLPVLEREADRRDKLNRIAFAAESRASASALRGKFIDLDAARARADAAGIPRDVDRERAMQNVEDTTALALQRERVDLAQREVDAAKERDDLSDTDRERLADRLNFEKDTLYVLTQEVKAKTAERDIDRERVRQAERDTLDELRRTNARTIEARNRAAGALGSSDPDAADKAAIEAARRQVDFAREDLEIAQSKARTSEATLDTLREQVVQARALLDLAKKEVEEKRRAEFVAIGKAGADEFLGGIKEGLTTGNWRATLSSFRQALEDTVVDAFLAATLKKPLESFFGQLATSIGGFFGAVKGGPDAPVGEGAAGADAGDATGVSAVGTAAKAARSFGGANSREKAPIVIVDISGVPDVLARRMGADGSRVIVARAEESMGVQARKPRS